MRRWRRRQPTAQRRHGRWSRHFILSRRRPPEAAENTFCGERTGLTHKVDEPETPYPVMSDDAHAHRA